MKNLLRSSKDIVKSVLIPVAEFTAGESKSLSLVNWDLTALPGLGLALDGVSLHELTIQFGSPVFVVHAAKLRRNAAAFVGDDADHEVFYSYKTNPVPGVLRLLHDAGVGAEVTSHFELWLARKLGVAPEKIVYNGSNKSEESIRDALRVGIRTLNLNHREEIAVVAKIARELSVRPKIGLRISTGEGWTFQFGTAVEGGAALDAFKEALAEPSLEVVGIHAHNGRVIRTEENLRRHIEGVLRFTDDLNSATGFVPQILNVGGSLGTPTTAPLGGRDLRLNRALGRDIPPPDPTQTLSIEQYVAWVVGHVRDHFRARGLPAPKVFMEPGRAMTGNTQHLVATVRAVKQSKQRVHAILDTGINHAESVRGEYHQLFPVKRFAHPHAERYTIVGPTCTPGDTLYGSAALPTLDREDTVVIMDAGAYFVPYSTSFSFPQPAIVLLDQGKPKVLRRAQTFEDIVRCDLEAGSL